MFNVRRALISVSNKDNILPFVKGLVELNIEILSTGGTAKILRDAGLEVIEVSEKTNFPEMSYSLKSLIVFKNLESLIIK